MKYCIRRDIDIPRPIYAVLQPYDKHIHGSGMYWRSPSNMIYIGVK